MSYGLSITRMYSAVCSGLTKYADTLTKLASRFTLRKLVQYSSIPLESCLNFYSLRVSEIPPSIIPKTTQTLLKRRQTINVSNFPVISP